MFTDYILRPLSNVCIPNLPFIPSSLADTVLSYASSVCGPCSEGSLKRAARHLSWPQAEGLQMPPSSTQQSCLHIPSPSPCSPGGVHKLAQRVEKPGVWSSLPTTVLSSSLHLWGEGGGLVSGSLTGEPPQM